MVNYILATKETVLTIKNSIFQSLKDRIFSKGLPHAFGQKIPILFLI